MEAKENGSPVEILMVEDNPGDVLLMEEALREGKLSNNLYIANNGDEAMDFLKKRGKFKDAVRPDLIMLDLNLPRKDGREVLAEVKNDPELKKIPIVIVTTSGSEEDIDKTYSLHANCYVTKPVGVRQFFEVVKNIESFWFSIVKLPSKAGK
ncbi:MAG: response regulator [Nitrospirae bacterium GWD2_57_9]|nr:MAG: response regulator [Nitrospirae bacterium GWD2_57_9]OGW49898.1 MAG: response regulator [Nitrospirae bacterium GWC2_57_9]